MYPIVRVALKEARFETNPGLLTSILRACELDHHDFIALRASYHLDHSARQSTVTEWWTSQEGLVSCPLTLPSPPMGERDVQGPGPHRLAITMAAC